MESNTKNILIILIVIVLCVIVVRGCQRVKNVKVTQKSNDTGSKLSVEVKKQPESNE